MNAADLPPELSTQPTGLIKAVRAIAQGPLASQAYAIDRGAYPADILKQLAASGAMSEHLTRADGTPGDYGQAILAMAEASKVCGATGFMMWCQCVAGLYMQASGNPALMGERLARHIAGETLGGTGLSNPMKSFAQIEALLLKATPVEGGYLVNGTLPWVSNLAPDHYFGAIASVQLDESGAGREMMFMLRCDAPGVTLKTCPEFSGMEGTGTYSVHCKDLFVGTDDVVADPAKPYIARIRGGFVLVQCGIAAGVVQGAIDSMWAVEGQLGHVNQFLEDRPNELQAELDALVARVMHTLNDPFVGNGKTVPLTASIGVDRLQELADAIRTQRLTRADSFLSLLRANWPRLGSALEGSFFLLGATYMALGLWGSIPLLTEAYERQEVIGNTGVFTLIIWPIKAVIVLGLGVSLIEFLRQFFRAWARVFRG